MNKNVLIIVIGNTGNEPEATRQSLENFGYSTLLLYVGRPKDFITALSNKIDYFNYDYIIISCHGEDGAIVMPELAEYIYEKDEPKGSFNAQLIMKYLSIKGKVIINTGCTTGCSDLMGTFSKDNCYIAPSDCIEATSTLFFIIRFFYELSQNKRSLSEAFLTASKTDSETELFVLKTDDNICE